MTHIPNKLNWLVVGIGDITTKRVIPAILAEPRSVLYGVVSRDRAKGLRYADRVWTDLADAVRSDDLASALDISSLARVVRDAVAERPRALVERITFDVARGVLARFPAVSEARVRVLKPRPNGLGADAEAVELVLRR